MRICLIPGAQLSSVVLGKSFKLYGPQSVTCKIKGKGTDSLTSPMLILVRHGEKAVRFLCGYLCHSKRGEVELFIHVWGLGILLSLFYLRYMYLWFMVNLSIFLWHFFHSTWKYRKTCIGPCLIYLLWSSKFYRWKFSNYMIRLMTIKSP